jgi:hypothetical protein
MAVDPWLNRLKPRRAETVKHEQNDREGSRKGAKLQRKQSTTKSTKDTKKYVRFFNRPERLLSVLCALCGSISLSLRLGAFA